MDHLPELRALSHESPMLQTGLLLQRQDRQDLEHQVTSFLSYHPRFSSSWYSFFDRNGRVLFSLSGHSDSVECVVWGGAGLLYSCSRDRTIKIWRVEDGILARTLTGHGHRVNFIALSTAYACRTGFHQPHQDQRIVVSSSRKEEEKSEVDGLQRDALGYYSKVRGEGGERLVSCSDDFSLILWSPEESKKPICRMTGHQQAVTHIQFSPSGLRIASASFDKKIKIWDGMSGAFLATLSSHVGAVFQVVWSCDSRYLVTASKDSTVKLWKASNWSKLHHNLPGHQDEVYALDWSPSASSVCSGSKDRTIKIWKN